MLYAAVVKINMLPSFLLHYKGKLPESNTFSLAYNIKPTKYKMASYFNQSKQKMWLAQHMMCSQHKERVYNTEQGRFELQASSKKDNVDYPT
jgi:hypothetical protein